MQGDTHKRRGRKKKKSKFGYYFYAIVVLFLTLANILLIIGLITHVQGIHVSGNKLSTSGEIVAWIKRDSMTRNSIYTWVKYNYGSAELPVYLEDIEVSFDAPWKLKVQVKEKQIVACVVDEGEFAYFDEEGLVLKKESEKQDAYPFIEGLDIKNTKQFRKMNVQDEKGFACAVKMAKELQKQVLNPDRIIWEDESLNLYFGSVCAKMGRTNYEEKVLQLSLILEELEGKKGTLDLEHYTSDSKNISFEGKE